MKTPTSILVLAILLGCSPSTHNIAHVSIEEYSHSSKCWRDHHGRLVSFVMFKEAGGGYVPSFLSFKCIPEEGHLKGAASYIENLNAFRVQESETNLASYGFSKQKLYDNDSVEFVIPDEMTQVYFVIADFSEERDIATIRKFESVIDTGISFWQFLRLTDSEIYELGARLNRSPD